MVRNFRRSGQEPDLSLMSQGENAYLVLRGVFHPSRVERHPPKRSIIAFVERVTTEGSSDFVPVAERIAAFDNDGTIWAEQPLYTQALFMIDRIKALAPGRRFFGPPPLRSWCADKRLRDQQFTRSTVRDFESI